ncbi:MAG: ABC transporter substrate-binding protein [Candidatus Sungiibacteriota bacterium]|uniref:ABC transporter substrate-binding protein n=1 Tax=Candidatus Sungiibacteriota bacterium TaxID=2750080 RepID=A0A7T5RJ77_9BACT|nr:MAG: ABC transporter substrate-binding protein [Candidatus Sungbacteria bacterium]
MKNLYKPNLRKIILGLVILIILVGAAYLTFIDKQSSNAITVGVITDLTGPAAYWGESTREGAQLAVNQLQESGIGVQVVFEDYQLEAARAVGAAQKLVAVDKVDAVYAEFNPAAISVGSFLKDKNILYVYDAAVVSPLRGLPYAYKTYLDYKGGCKAIAKKFKETGVNKIGVLKVNLEFGELCLEGVKEIYGNPVISEGYNLGDTDFRTQLLKIKGNGANAVINVGFEGDTYNTLKTIRDFQYKMLYGTVDDTITDKVKKDFTSELKGGFTFGFRDVDPVFRAKLKAKLQDKTLATEYAAALAYTHIRQITEALHQCNKDLSCVIKKLDAARPDPTIGFERFDKHIGVLDMSIRSY